MKVTVLGNGNWGTTVAAILARRHDTLLWGRRPELAEEINTERTNSRYLAGFTLPKRLRATADLQEAVTHAELLIVGVPTHALRDTVAEARQWVHPWIPVVSLAKGFEEGSLLRMSEVITEELPTHPVAVLTGPNIAREIMAGQAAASVIATHDLSVATALQKVISSGLFRVYSNNDVVGSEVGGGLKNVVAIACGIAQGLSVGDNTRSMVMTRGLAELTRLGVAMGGDPSTFAGLTGMGDLVTTCMSPNSRNRTVGERLGQGMTVPEVIESMNMVAEGLKAARTAYELASQYGIAMPIHETIYEVVTEQITPNQAYRGLAPPPGHELEPDLAGSWSRRASAQ